MDFKDWEKILEKPDVIIMRHRKGHTMNIAVNALPKIQREQLKRLELAKGGQVSNDHLDSGEEDGVSAQGQAVRAIHKSKEKEDNENMDEEKEYAREEAKGRADFEKKFVKPKLKGFVLGGNVSQDETAKPEEQQPDQSQEVPRSPTSGNHAPITIINNTGPQPQAAQAQQPPPAPVSNLQPQQNNPPQETVPQMTDKVPASPTLLHGDQTLNAPAAFNLQQQGIQESQQVEAEKAKAAIKNETEALEGTQQLKDFVAQSYNDLKSQTDAANEDIKNLNANINPRHYQESMSTGEKVGTAIGLFLGGFGTAFGGHNFAMDFLNKQIDRDLKSQQKKINNTNTVLGAYQHLYGKSEVATNMTKIFLNDQLVHKTNISAAKLGTPQAAAAAKLLQSQKAMENDSLLENAAGRLGVIRAGSRAGKNSSDKKDEPLQKQKHLEGSLLKQGSEEDFKNLAYVKKAAAQLPEITRQFTQAQQADKALKQINNTFLDLWKNANESGVSGRTHRTLSPHSIAALGAGVGALGGPIGAGIGAGIGEGIGHAAQQFTNTDVNRSYDSRQSELKGYISSALKGTNISSSDIDDIVSKNSPEYGDSEKTIAGKLKTIRDFIKNHTETSLLKTWELTDD